MGGVIDSGEDRGPLTPRLHTLCLQVHATLELLALMVVVFELCMKLRWLGLHTFIRHRRTMVKVMCPLLTAFSSRVTFKPISSVQFQIPLHQKWNPGSLPSSCSGGWVTVMLTAADVIPNLGRAEHWTRNLCGRCITIPSSHPARQPRKGSEAQREWDSTPGPCGLQAHADLYAALYTFSLCNREEHK